jgi:hypothetical protein
MKKVDLTTLKVQLPRGYTSRISKKIGITPQAVSIALGKAEPNPRHPAVIEALKLRDQHRSELIRLQESINQ